MVVKGEGEKGEALTNILKNAVPQFDFRQGKQVMGGMEFVAIEVLVSFILRYFIKADKRSLLNLAAVHTASIPFLGAIAEEKHPLGLEAPLAYQFMVGLRQIPAVWFAEYVVSTGSGAGLHIPKPSVRDVLLSSASKLISRPLLSLLYPYIGETLRTNLDVLEELVSRQQKNAFGGPKKKT